MRPSRVKTLWSRGRPALCTQVTLSDPVVCELVSRLGFDCVWIDMEHHVTSVESASQMMRAVRVGPADVIARPGKGEFMRMGRMAAVEQARAMAEVDGVDVLFFGPGDFSVLTDVPGRFDAEVVVHAMEHACRSALAAGKRFGTLVFDVEHARRVLDLGGTFIACGADLPLLRRGFERLRDELSPLGFELDGGAATPERLEA